MAAAPATRPATITKQADGAIVAQGAAYTVVVDPAGNLVSLKVRGIEMLDVSGPRKGAAFPAAEGAATVMIDGAKVSASRGNIRVDYAFDDAGFDVATEGGALEYRTRGVTAAVCEAGVTVDGKQAVGDVRKLVAGDAAIGLSKPFHHMFGRLVPSHLCGRGGKPEAPFAYRVDCGVGVAPVELLAVVGLVAEGQDPNRVPTYAAAQTPVFVLTMANLGGEAVEGEVSFTLRDHRVNGKIVAGAAQAARVPAGSRDTAFRFSAQGVNEPGFYWLEAEFRMGGVTHKRARLAFIHDAGAYRPALTRPDDFRPFWNEKLRQWRAAPFDAKLTESPERSSASSVHYDLEITAGPGRRIRTFLRVPAKPGRYDGEVVSHWGSDSPEKVLKMLEGFEKQPAGAGMWQRGEPRIRVGAPQPQDSTFTRWNGRDDNNMLESYLLTLRLADYLRGRDDVRDIYLFGASRSGPIMIAVAALDPAKIAAVNVHVPTSAGLSWKDKEYRGWGSRPADLSVAAYFDPVNFAPDLAVPLLVDGGIDDDLAPAPGILALANHATRSPWVRCSIEKGGHGFFSNPARNRYETELAAYLKQRPAR